MIDDFDDGPYPAVAAALDAIDDHVAAVARRGPVYRLFADMIHLRTVLALRLLERPPRKPRKRRRFRRSR